ncbi:hypothetical protein [Streptomyces sp. URMC 123]|uniref:hypothetical protein n=1 Tax=Streptomyces sp. URMC 123 TaxID=3423403 RepID=UPI003F1E17D4
MTPPSPSPASPQVPRAAAPDRRTEPPTAPTPPSPPAAPSHPAPRPSHTEATRLLCAGAYLDTEFRRRVIEELVEHEERSLAPSLGIDAVPVLAHALRSRRQEAETALLLLAVWAAFIAVDWVTATGSTGLPPLIWSLGYGLLCFLLWAGRAGTGRSVAVYTLDRRTLKRATRGRLKVLVPVSLRILMLAYWAMVLFLLIGGEDMWHAVLFPLLLTVPVWLHRSRVAAVMRDELGREAFETRPRAEPPATDRYRRITAAIDREQHAALTIYDPFRPFMGAGKPYEPWSFVLELRRKAARDGSPPAPARTTAEEDRLTSRTVVDLIRPRLEALRSSAAETSRDRLCGLEIDEFVYLPVGLPRAEVSYAPRTVGQHLRDAVDEGGEARRHFLRVRVGAWDEQVVVSVLVRVHTQGGMLVLEVVPHVLTPVRQEFKAVDVIAARGEEDVARDGVRALLTSPTANFASAVSAVRTAVALFRIWLADPRRALPDGPATSVRELGSTTDISLFQEMDVARYVKTVQDRIISGVHEALRARGYDTGEFEQQIVNVSGGGVFIGSMSGGAVATGNRARASQRTDGKTNEE